MFGYATDETEECMPLTIILAHKLNAKMAELRRDGTLPWIRPDSKTQVRRGKRLSAQQPFQTLLKKNCICFLFFLPPKLHYGSLNSDTIFLFFCFFPSSFYFLHFLLQTCQLLPYMFIYTVTCISHV